MHEIGNCSRRAMIRGGVVAAAGALLAAPFSSAAATAEQPNQPDRWRGLKVGVASYSLRKLPVDAAIKAISRVGLNYVSIKEFHLALNSTAEQRRAGVQKFTDAGITPLSCGVITMQNNEANVRAAFEYARDCGIPTIVCNPDPDSMPILDRMVKEFDIRLAIHNHGPEDKRYPTPYEPMKLAERYDPRIGVCIDVGHTARAGADPAEAILKCRERLYDVHLKDLSRLDRRGSDVEAGRGVLDVKAMVSALLEIRYAHHVGFEFEKDPDDPVPGLAESTGYVRGVLAGMS